MKSKTGIPCFPVTYHFVTASHVYKSMVRACFLVKAGSDNTSEMFWFSRTNYFHPVF